MAHEQLEKRPWDDEDRFYSSSHSDDSPILSYRYEKRHYMPYAPASPPEERERGIRSPFSVLGKCCLFSVAMILFCVLMYIPVYNKANYDLPKGIVAGWSSHTNRDTKIYVQPYNVTTIHEPSHVCNKDSNGKLPLLIIVCSSTENFERRKAIRETWANFVNYKDVLKILKDLMDKYKNYTYSYDLYPNDLEKVQFIATNESDSTQRIRVKRHISSFKELLPALAKALTNISLTNAKTEEVPEKRFDDDSEENGAVLPDFDMNKELESNNIEDYVYDYESNVMRIPPKGDENEQNVPDLNKVLDLIKQSKDFNKIKEIIHEPDNTKEFEVVFLLGLPEKGKIDLQKKIEEEIKQYGDIIQEGFVDSYNNLTLKSIMMLKWVTNKCNGSVRYILKADDDTYVNVPYLMMNLKNRSQEFDRKNKESGAKEYLLIGDIFVGAKPVLDTRSKWFSPRYMYSGRVYPRYLSGHGYAMSLPAAFALYEAALRTRYFHLEDIYITGICSSRASPRVFPRDDPSFSYYAMRQPLCAQSHATVHRVSADDMRHVQRILLQPDEVDRCERIRLTQVRHARLQKLRQRKRITARPKT